MSDVLKDDELPTLQGEREPLSQKKQEQRMSEYLTENPDFFNRHTETLHALSIPHACGTAVSLIEKQVSVLQQECRVLKAQLQQIIEAGHDNQQRYERLHTMMLALMASDTLHAAFEGMAMSLSKDFNIETSLLYLRSSLFSIKKKVRSDNAELLPLSDESMKQLFAVGPRSEKKSSEEKSKNICAIIDNEPLLDTVNKRHELQLESGAWLPLGEDSYMGVLILGSRDKERFHAGMETFFLSNFSECLAAKLRNLI